MSTISKSQLLRGVTIGASFIIVTLILWNTYVFFQRFKSEERQKMEILGKAFDSMAQFDLDADMELEDAIIQTYTKNPMIHTDREGNIVFWANTGIREINSYDSLTNNEQQLLQRKLLKMKKENPPIRYNWNFFDVNIEGNVYYSNSDLLNKLTYYPIALILILVLFTSVLFFYFKSSKIAENNRLWTGMAKETAHQIGTPLSSLLGWIALLRLENVDESYVSEIEKDVNRLNTIAERFSKIGSIPVLTRQNVVVETENAFEYLKSRSSKQIAFTFKSESKELYTDLNLQLYGWVIENLVKNAIDSMKGKGSISIDIQESIKTIHILITDNGKGIAKNLRQKIFSPGFTTKKRGWGLGLSLSKRIVEEYHNGKIFVKKSEIEKGTTFCVTLKKS